MKRFWELASREGYIIRVARLGFTTYNTAGTAKLRGSHIRRRFLRARLWVGKSPQVLNLSLYTFRVDNAETSPLRGHLPAWAAR